jgi:hypothetical protein
MKTHLCIIAHVLETAFALPRGIRTPLAPPILDALVGAIVRFEVLAQAVGIADVVCDLCVARALVVCPATDRVACEIGCAGLVCDVGDLCAVARVAGALLGGHCVWWGGGLGVGGVSGCVGCCGFR